MKKIFALFMGIVFLISCTSKNNDAAIVSNKGKKRVTIYLRSIELNGKKHLSMFDSNGDIDIDSLVTDVHPGDKIIWRLERLSGIKRITKIYSTEKVQRIIFVKDPRKQFLGKGYKLKLSNDVGKGRKDTIVEAYAIQYIHWDNDTVTIDPYIRILPD